MSDPDPLTEHADPEHPDPFPNWGTVDDDGFFICGECWGSAGQKPNPATVDPQLGHDEGCPIGELLDQIERLRAAIEDAIYQLSFADTLGDVADTVSVYLHPVLEALNDE